MGEDGDNGLDEGGSPGWGDVLDLSEGDSGEEAVGDEQGMEGDWGGKCPPPPPPFTITSSLTWYSSSFIPGRLLMLKLLMWRLSSSGGGLTSSWLELTAVPSDPGLPISDWGPGGAFTDWYRAESELVRRHRASGGGER